MIRFLIAFFLSCSVAMAGQGMGPGPGNKTYSSGNPTVTFGAIGTGATGTTSATPTYPTGISATDSLFCIVTGRSNTASTAPTMPAGWTSVGSLEGGTGTWAVDAGTRRVDVFRKDLTTGSESGTVKVSLAGSTNNTMYASIVRVAADTGYDIAVEWTSGADTSNDTSWSVTGSTSPTWASGNLLLVATARSVDTVTSTSDVISASGIGFGTITNKRSIASVSGYDHRHVIDTIPVSSGTGTVAPTWSYTASANVSGVNGFLVLKPTTPPTPTITSATITGGTTTLVLNGSIPLTRSSDTGLNVDCTTAGTDITATYASGSPGSALTYTLGTTVNVGDGCNVDYTQPGNGIESSAWGTDVATFSNLTATVLAGNNDAFTATNGTLLATHDSNWVSAGIASSDVASCVINSNILEPSSTFASCGAMYNTSSSDSSQAVFKGGATTSDSFVRQVCVRMTSTTGYCAYFGDVSGGNWTSTRIDKGLSTIDCTVAAGTWAQASDHTVKITASGTSPVTITVYVDSVQAQQYVDSTSPLASGSPGFELWGNGTLANSRIDDWTDQ